MRASLLPGPTPVGRGGQDRSRRSILRLRLNSPAQRFAQLLGQGPSIHDLKSRSLRSGFQTAAASFSDLVLRLGSTAILARLISPADFGLIMMVAAVIGIADQLKELGLSAATVQKPAITCEEVTNLFWINVAVGLALALCLCAVSPLLSAYYRESRLTPLTCLLSLTFVFGGLTVQHQALLTRQMRLGRTALIRLLASVASTALAVYLAFHDYGYWALLWREVSRGGFLALGMWVSFPWCPGLPAMRTDVRPLLKFGTNLTLANISTAVTSGMDRFFLGRAWGPESVGIYRQAFQLITAPTDQLLSPIYQVAHPALCMLQDDPGRFRRYFVMVLCIVSAITMPLSLFVAVFAPALTHVLLGDQWLPCAPIIAVLALGTFIRQTSGSTALILLAGGRSQTHLALIFSSNLLLIALLFAGAHWGALGVAAAEVAATFLFLFPRLHFTLRGSPVSFPDFFAAIARPALASLAMAAVLWGLSATFPLPSDTLRIGVGAALAPVLFLGTWSLLPGGRLELTGLFNSVREGFLRKAAASA